MITSTPCQKALWGSDCFAWFRRKKRRLARFFLQWQVLVFEWWPIAYTFRQLKHSVDKATTAVRWCTKTYSDWHISFVTWHVLIPLFPWHCRTMIFFTGYDTAVGERGMKLSGGESESPGIISADECEGYLWISWYAIICYKLILKGIQILEMIGCVTLYTKFEYLRLTFDYVCFSLICQIYRLAYYGSQYLMHDMLWLRWLTCLTQATTHRDCTLLAGRSATVSDSEQAAVSAELKPNLFVVFCKVCP